MTNSRNVSSRPPSRKPVPFTERTQTVEPTQRTTRTPSHARSRLVSAQNATKLPRWVVVLVAFGVPAVALFGISMLLSGEGYSLNTKLFTERLLRATILALSGGAAVAMFVAVFGRGSQNLSIAVKIAALVLATAALVLGILFGLLM